MTWGHLITTAALVSYAVVGCSSTSKEPGHVGFEVPPARSSPAAETDTDIAPDSLPQYQPATDLSGKITSIGASTTTYLVAHAAARFKRIHPDVSLQITASLVSIGPRALLEGQADIAPMGRPLTPEEIQSFVAKYGYPPTQIKVAADALAVFVEKRNPLPGLTLEQLDGIFSRTQRRSGSGIDAWGQLGLTGEWADRPLILYGYGPKSGAHEIFKQKVLDGGTFRLSLRVGGGGSSIVQGVAANVGAIGFASNFFTAKRVRAVPLAGADGQFFAPTQENLQSGDYPLVRFLYVCVNKPPSQPLRGPAAEFLRFLLSREGQQVVAEGGNIPLDAATVAAGRRAMR